MAFKEANASGCFRNRECMVAVYDFRFIIIYSMHHMVPPLNDNVSSSLGKVIGCFTEILIW